MPPHAVQTETLWETDPQQIQSSGNNGMAQTDGNEDITTTTTVNEPLVSSSSTPVKRGVRFLETVSFREIAPLTELSEIEIASVWYNDDEYARIKKHVSDTIKRISSSSSNGNIKEGGEVIIKDGNGKEEIYCMRGLEGRTKFGARRRKNNKARALNSVWETQIELWKKKVYDSSTKIAAAYRPHSMHAKYPAIQTGLKDEQFVKEQQHQQQQQEETTITTTPKR